MALVWWLAACGPGPARQAIEAEGPASATEVAADWTCPMHPAVHSAGPGTCPHCAMALVESKAGR